ncbi:oxygen-insensitive NADPH nitroreductase [Paenibacillus glucanolyticus]|jgi:FMN reductase (NADPH)|uniref:oxygen-insensitive NADPH nitroreductase n=1 Tax=Paenibacillus TaxID=44249 RepID=UPI0003E2A2D6|nr:MULTISPECIES: oxygen-insensitive NADPH nitroreductase [Paenibacillus]ANA80691.1 NADPH-dependent oxidoreductase [Paenibacillus glucanolyticus]AVV55238.1 oxygen-insensitive NADPH nitroreductase [Paenibacillus glucanolyticus]ETT30844.1 nitroreductase [Paenibacillus sp. FSL R5-808]MDH6671541.1 FMN reductase (NADPH) [Paenibacillus sp. LBL]MPY15538.1 oxygen-insensitive NADPH nitroreductase [Paenibacillus glucanolyticus]
MNDTLSLLMNHRSIRKYLDKPVSEEQLRAVVAAGQMASTSSNVQAYSIIAVTDQEKKRRLAGLAGNQAYIIECPVFLVWCADLYRLKKSTEAHSGDKETYEDSTENFIVATVDAALAAQNAAIAAESLGLGIVYIGGVRNSIADFSEALELPDLVYPVFGMCLGYPDQDPGLRPRLPVEAVLHRDSYNPGAIEEVRSYDQVSADYLSKRTAGKNSTPWSELMAKRLAEPVRLHMKDFLNGKGFMKR